MPDGTYESGSRPRRLQGRPWDCPGRSYHFADLTLDTGLCRVTRAGLPIALGKLSYRMLHVLVESARKVVSQREFAERVWNRRVVSSQTITQRVKLLREALCDRAASPRYIGLVRGHGYRLLPEVRAVEGEHARLKRLAVLPFETFSVETADAYFAGGLHEELLTRLAASSGMQVLARTSVLRYAGARRPIVEIADELGVGWVIEGSVRHTPDRVRVTVQLIDGVTGVHAWAEVFERRVEPVFETQIELATQVSTRLRSNRKLFPYVTGHGH